MRLAGKWRNLCAVRDFQPVSRDRLRILPSSIFILSPDMDPLLQAAPLPFPVLSEPAYTSPITMTSLLRSFFHVKYYYSPSSPVLHGSSGNSRVQGIFPSSCLLKPIACTISLFACVCTCLFSFIGILFSMYFNCSHESSLCPN